MDRRRFIILGTRTLGAGLVGTAAIPGRGLPTQPACAASAAAPAGSPDLVIARGEPQKALYAALDAVGGMQRFVKPGNVVVVKPNASFMSPPAWGATTHPQVLAAVITACLESGARRVLVVDHTLSPAKKCFARTGVAAAVADFSNAKLVSLDNQKTYREVEIPSGEALHKTEIAKVVLKSDVLINLPTAKSHPATGVSFGMKNLMGLIWDRETFHRDIDVHVGVADLASIIRPDLTILDAVQLLKTGGPDGPGDVESFGGVVVGTDPVAVDAYAVGLTTWNRQTLKPDQIGYIRQAAKRGIGSMDLKSLNILKLT